MEAAPAAAHPPTDFCFLIWKRNKSGPRNTEGVERANQDKRRDRTLSNRTPFRGGFRLAGPKTNRSRKVLLVVGAREKQEKAK